MKHVALFSLVLVVGCSSTQLPSSPTPNAAPIPAAANVAGNWSGAYTITGCEGQRHCSQLIGRSQPFYTRLTQLGEIVTGVFLSIDVAGVVHPDGTVTLKGAAPPVSRYSPARELLRFSGHIDPTRGLVGSFEYQETYPPTMEVGWPIKKTSGHVSSTTRGPTTDPSSFDGTWSGYLVNSQCTPTGWRDCSPLSLNLDYPISLQLHQAGDSVHGVFDMGSDIPVTGRIVGDRLTLDGATTTESGSIIRITSWSATRDAVGRLSGSFSFVWDSGLVGSPPSPHSSHYHAELVSVILQP